MPRKRADSRALELGTSYFHLAMIIFVLPALAYLTGIVQAVASNSTCPSCPQPACDGTTRSVWSILGSCALTLLICVWHAIHLNVYSSQAEWLSNLVLLILAAFFAPEFVVMVASQEFWVARDKVNKFRGMLSSILNRPQAIGSI